MPEQEPTQDGYDTPWKEVVELFFQDFLAFFLPMAHDEIDWEQEVTFLDKELPRITREAESSDRCMDKLAKVRRKASQQDQWVLVHVDQQGKQQAVFPERMYVYQYRAFDLKHIPVVGIAILTDDSPTWRPVEYRQELWGCQIVYRFNMVKLLDYQERLEELEQSSNPFSVVVWAHLQARTTRKDAEKRYQVKRRIVRSLYHRGFNKQQIIGLFRFVDWVLSLPKEADQQFLQDLSAFEEQQKMPYITSVERIGEERGVLRGRQDERRVILEQLLRGKFGPLPDHLEVRLRQAPLNDLKLWTDRFMTAQSLADVFDDL